ncbi:cell surface glycoprotein (s-layer protein)-like protein [Anaeramoeba flamelloides]|uniref:Cell surface glycoprotein (S-layer protein)-like protein n=1 Tax=Anaeramoeba flamelloides TaxID=1746091 RepID=A0AAV7YX32_9EUKA|nr:cell surface glycoprotein (s-layer protein)-like protein [Anaeramoeba flamelloides]
MFQNRHIKKNFQQINWIVFFLVFGLTIGAHENHVFQANTYQSQDLLQKNHYQEAFPKQHYKHKYGNEKKQMEKMEQKVHLKSILYPLEDGKGGHEYRCKTFQQLDFRFTKDQITLLAKNDLIKIKFLNSSLADLQPNHKLKSVTSLINSLTSLQNLPNYESVTYKSILPGIDVEYSVTENGLKSSYFLQKAILYQDIKIQYSIKNRNTRLVVGKDGSLLFVNKMTNQIILQESVPIFIQNSKQIVGSFEIIDQKNSIVVFQLENFSQRLLANQPLIIDPNFSTFYGGSEIDTGQAIQVDKDYNTYITGETRSANFQTTPGSLSVNYTNHQDVFVMKLDDSHNLLWSTFLGSDAADYIGSLALDSNGNPLITGYSYNTNLGPKLFPTTPGAYQSSCFVTSRVPFVSKISSSGDQLVFSTLLCPNETAKGVGIQVDESDQVYIYGNNVNGIEGSTCAYPGVWNLFVVQLNSDGTQLLNANCLGGYREDIPFVRSTNFKYANDNLYFTSITKSPNFPTFTNSFQKTKTNDDNYGCVIGKFEIASFQLVSSSYVSGNAPDYCFTVELDQNRHVWLGGHSFSTNLGTSIDAYQRQRSGNVNRADGFFYKFSNDLSSVLYGSFLGLWDETESIRDIKIDSDNLLYMVGTGNPFKDYEFNYNYGRGNFLAIFNAEATEIIKKISIGCEEIYSLIIGPGKDHFSIVGEVAENSPLKITSNNLQANYGGGEFDMVILSVDLNCSRGEYGTLEGCEICEAGTFQSNFSAEGKDSCIECDLGTFSTAGSSTCSECELGTYGNLKKLSQCFNCPMGTYNSEHTGATSDSVCVKCQRGTYSDRIGATDASTCVNCTMGYYSTIEGSAASSNCLPCPSGTYATASGLDDIDSCAKCLPGEYSTEVAATSSGVCIKCPAGKYNSRSGAGSFDYCLDCPVGTYNTLNGSVSVGECNKCSAGTISSGIAATSCMLCGIGEETDGRQSECIKCQKGSYSNSVGGQCTKCPVNTINNKIGSSSCLKCSSNDQCLGSNVCSFGRDPEKYCTTCQKGYFMIGTKCNECPQNVKVILLLCIIVIILLLIFVFRIRIMKFAKSTKNPMKGIIFTFLQILAAIFALNLNGPSIFDNLKIWTSFLNGQLSIILAPECYQSFDTFFSRWLFMFLIPILFSVLVLMMFFYYAWRYKSDPERIDRRRARLIYWYTLILKWLYLPYVIISIQPFDFTYQESEKKWTLDSDPNLDLNSDQWRKYLPMYIISVLLYIFAIPIAFIIILYKAKRADFSEYYYKRYRWMYQWFKPNRYWFELVELGLKFSMMVTSLFFGIKSEYQPWAVMSIFVFVIILFLIFRPHRGDTPRYVAEDKASIGFFLILISITSLTVPYLYNSVFVIFWTLGCYLVYIGTRGNWTWYKIERIKLKEEFDKEQIEKKERKQQRKESKKKQKLKKNKLKNEKKESSNTSDNSKNELSQSPSLGNGDSNDDIDLPPINDNEIDLPRDIPDLPPPTLHKPIRQPPPPPPRNHRRGDN